MAARKRKYQTEKTKNTIRERALKVELDKRKEFMSMPYLHGRCVFCGKLLRSRVSRLPSCYQGKCKQIMKWYLGGLHGPRVKSLLKLPPEHRAVSIIAGFLRHKSIESEKRAELNRAVPAFLTEPVVSLAPDA